MTSRARCGSTLRNGHGARPRTCPRSASAGDRPRHVPRSCHVPFRLGGRLPFHPALGQVASSGPHRAESLPRAVALLPHSARACGQPHLVIMATCRVPRPPHAARTAQYAPAGGGCGETSWSWLHPHRVHSPQVRRRRRPAGERAGGGWHVYRGQPGTERVRAVGFDTDRQADRGVEPQPVPDARQRVDDTEPAERAQPDPAGPDRDSSGGGDQEQGPAPPDCASVLAWQSRQRSLAGRRPMY
jgi:hypothetical protein